MGGKEGEREVGKDVKLGCKLYWYPKLDLFDFILTITILLVWQGEGGREKESEKGR